MAQIENNVVNKETGVHREHGGEQSNLLCSKVIHRDSERGSHF